MRIIIHTEYVDKKDAVIRLTDEFFNEGELIVKGARNIIKSNKLGEEKVNIKYFQSPGFIKSLIYSFFRKSKAERSYRYAEYLLENGIQTPFPIACIEERNGLGLLGNSYYVSRHIDYDFTIRELIHDPLFPDRDLILEQFAEFTFRLHEANVNFLDHSPGNTLIVKEGNGKYGFYLIDLNRMQFEKMNTEARMANFRKMWLSRKMIKVIAGKYAQLSGQPKELLHEILLKTMLDFKRKITRKKWLKRKIKQKK